MSASQQQFIAHAATALGSFYVAAALLNALAALYAWRKARCRWAAAIWLLVGAAFGGLAVAAFRGHPLTMPQQAKLAVDAALGPVTFTVGTFALLTLLFLARGLFVRPGVAWTLFNASLVFLGASLADPYFAAAATRPDNLPIVAMVYLFAFFTWLGAYQAVKNDRRLAQGQPPIESADGETVLAWPDVVYVELIGMILGMVVLIVWSLLVRAPLEQPANPAITPNPSKAPWYFVGLQEMLVYFDPSVAGVIIPVLIIFGLLAIPYIDRNPQGNGYYTIRQRRFAYVVFQFGFLQLWVMLILLGTFFRGPNWSFFGLYEPPDVYRVTAIQNIKLSEYFWAMWLGRSVPQVPVGATGLSQLAHVALRELPGIVVLAAWFIGLPLVLGRTVLRSFRQQLGRGRWIIVSLLLMMMLMIPLKMILHWTFHLSYILSMPEYSFNF